jgi:integrase
MYDKKEMKTIMSHAENAQDAVVISLLYYERLSFGEIVRLKIGDIDTQSGIITVDGGIRSRKVIACQESLKLIQDAYFQTRYRDKDGNTIELEDTGYIVRPLRNITLSEFDIMNRITVYCEGIAVDLTWLFNL